MKVMSGYTPSFLVEFRCMRVSPVRLRYVAFTLNIVREGRTVGEAAGGCVVMLHVVSARDGWPDDFPHAMPVFEVLQRAGLGGARAEQTLHSLPPSSLPPPSTPHSPPSLPGLERWRYAGIRELHGAILEHPWKRPCPRCPLHCRPYLTGGLRPYATVCSHSSKHELRFISLPECCCFTSPSCGRREIDPPQTASWRSSSGNVQAAVVQGSGGLMCRDEWPHERRFASRIVGKEGGRRAARNHVKGVRDQRSDARRGSHSCFSSVFPHPRDRGGGGPLLGLTLVAGRTREEPPLGGSVWFNLEQLSGVYSRRCGVWCVRCGVLWFVLTASRHLPRRCSRGCGGVREGSVRRVVHVLVTRCYSIIEICGSDTPTDTLPRAQRGICLLE
ncbi:hypothetical protein O3P69_003776 [Scylla paramamosain]|uniref:Uncharacterized protein n=1 Tax=Scylla paramamosain TaxID=85552 RepID=A0AAW0UIS1_SCYPA